MSGTALTVERINADGVWEGGAIALGLTRTAEALHQLSPRLPLVAIDTGEDAAFPAAWGRSTAPCLEAGVFWGAVGAVRALVAEQARGLGESTWVAFTGGDAPILQRAAALPYLCWSGPTLVLDGLRAAAEAEAAGA
jgi:type III pantothenate kinase